MLGYLSVDITCSERQTTFRERSSKWRVAFTILEIFFAASAVFETWGISLGYPQVGGIFSHAKREAFRVITRERKYSKCGKGASFFRTGGEGIFYFISVFYILGTLLIKKIIPLIHPLSDLPSYPTRSSGTIFN